MKCEKTAYYYITIALKSHSSQAVRVNLIKTKIESGESFNKVAKETRKSVIKNNFSRLNNTPSSFGWAVYEEKFASEDDEYFFPGEHFFSLVCESDFGMFNDELPWQ